MQNDRLYRGIEQHKRAAINGMQIISKRYKDKYQSTRNIDIFIDGNIEKLGEYEDFV